MLTLSLLLATAALTRLAVAEDISKFNVTLALENCEDTCFNTTVYQGLAHAVNYTDIPTTSIYAVHVADMHQADLTCTVFRGNHWRRTFDVTKKATLTHTGTYQHFQVVCDSTTDDVASGNTGTTQNTDSSSKAMDSSTKSSSTVNNDDDTSPAVEMFFEYCSHSSACMNTSMSVELNVTHSYKYHPTSNFYIVGASFSDFSDVECEVMRTISGTDLGYVTADSPLLLATDRAWRYFTIQCTDADNLSKRAAPAVADAEWQSATAWPSGWSSAWPASESTAWPSEAAWTNTWSSTWSVSEATAWPTTVTSTASSSTSTTWAKATSSSSSSSSSTKPFSTGKATSTGKGIASSSIRGASTSTATTTSVVTPTLTPHVNGGAPARQGTAGLALAAMMVAGAAFVL